MLHIVNGASTTAQLRRTATVRGDFVSWGDLLMEGPVVHGLISEQDWALRADHLERRFGIPQAEYQRRMAESLGALENLADRDEVVLWFEEDWFCQLHLAFILARLGQQ